MEPARQVVSTGGSTTTRSRSPNARYRNGHGQQELPRELSESKRYYKKSALGKCSSSGGGLRCSLRPEGRSFGLHRSPMLCSILCMKDRRKATEEPWRPTRRSEEGMRYIGIYTLRTCHFAKGSCTRGAHMYMCRRGRRESWLLHARVRPHKHGTRKRGKLSYLCHSLPLDWGLPLWRVPLRDSLGIHSGMFIIALCVGQARCA